MDLKSVLNKNYYEILGLSREACSKEIRSHYHELARAYHPDSNFYSEITGEKVSAEQIELFKIITSAYHTLIDPKKRREYDAEIFPFGDKKVALWEDPVDPFFDTQSLSTRNAESGDLKRGRKSSVEMTAVRKIRPLGKDEVKKALQTKKNTARGFSGRNKKSLRLPLIAFGAIATAVIGILIFTTVKNPSAGSPSIKENTYQPQTAEKTNTGSLGNNLD